MGASEVLFSIVAGLFALAVASRGFQVEEDYVARWANSANVALTNESRPVVRRYLAWSRRCRTAGGLAGFLAPVITSAVIGKPDDPGPWAVALMVVGYLLGALLAEVVINRPERGKGTALLVPRRLGDYLPAYVLVLQRGLAILSVLMVPVYALLEPHARFSTPSVAGAAAFGVAGVCIAAVIEGLQRRIVARRQPVTRAADDHDDACAGRLVPEDRPADRDRLSGHDLGHCVAALHRVRVHHPRHRLLVRRHVWRRDVLLWPDDREQLGGEPARQALELSERECARIAANAALRPAVRQAEEGALPGHPHRERGALSEGHLRVVADSALRRAHDAGVLDAVAGEDDPSAVVHAHRDADDGRALGVSEPLGDVIGNVRDRDRLIELRDRHAVKRRIPLELGMGKRFLRARHGAPSVPAGRRDLVLGLRR